jgi:hypothetical protein
MWSDILSAFLVLLAGGMGGGLIAIAFFYGYTALRGRTNRKRWRDSAWEPATRVVGDQTWVVVQRVHRNTFGRTLMAEQLIAVIGKDADDHDNRVRRRERLAELRAAWLNNGEPETPKL